MIKFSAAVLNALLNAIEATIGTGAVVKWRTGAPPTNITDADSGTVVATFTLPSDWMADAASGVKAETGTWTCTGAAVPGGTVGHFRVYASDGTTAHCQGTVTSTLVGTGDMLIDNPVIVAGQTCNLPTFTLTAPNA